MTGWVILVDQPKDLPNADTPHKVITTSEYLARPRLFDMGRPKLVNLARSYAYQSKGYYASLLAEARGHRVVPTVETMLELREAKLYEHALPKLEDELNRCARRADFQPEGEFKLLVCFGITRDPRFESFARMLFDWFRCPALEVNVEAGTWLSIDRIRPRNITRLANGEALFLREALHQHTKREWRDPKARTVPKYDLAVLYDPNEKMAPSSPDSIKHMARIAERLSLHDPLHQQGFSHGALGPEPGGDAADRDARRRRRSAESDGRARPAAGCKNSRRLVLARHPQSGYA